MNRDNFLNTPAAWTRAQRTSQPAQDYACAVESFNRGANGVSRAFAWIACAALAGLAAYLYVCPFGG